MIKTPTTHVLVPTTQVEVELSCDGFKGLRNVLPELIDSRMGVYNKLRITKSWKML